MLPQHERFFSETQRRVFAEGMAKGEAEGKAKGLAEALLRVLDRRGLEVSAEQRERVLACADAPALERWLDAAVTASTTEAVFR